MSRYPASLALFLLGFHLLVLQPGAIPLAYAAVHRVRRLGAARPWQILAALTGWLVGCVLGTFSLAGLAAIPHMRTAPDWVAFLLSYLPLWLLAWLLRRARSTPDGRADPSPEDRADGSSPRSGSSEAR
jgi:hypothetical protein